MGVLTRISDYLSAQRAKFKNIIVAATYLKTHHTAPSLAQKRGSWAPDWVDQGRYERQAPRHQRCQRAPLEPIYRCPLCPLLYNRSHLAPLSAQGAVNTDKPGR